MREVNFDIAEIFEVDGSLRDIIIKDTDIYCWNKMINHIQSCQYELEWRVDSEPIHIKDFQVETIFKKELEHNILLVIKIGKAKIHCHFFCGDEIEMDINPQEVDNIETIEKIFSFVEQLSVSLNKEASITPEGMPEVHLIRFYP
jgi:hypothetical protein